VLFRSDNLGVAIGILVFAIALETVSLRTAVREAKHAKGDRVGWWTWLRKSKQPELPVVLLEDIGAETGLIFALGGVVLAHFTEEPRWDAVGSIAIGVLLVVIAIVLAIEMKGLLIGESASDTDLERIIGALESADGVRRLIHLRTQHLGPDEVLVGAKLEFDAALSSSELAAAINGAEGRLRAEVPIARVVYIEPDLYEARTPT
jgi:divalent metal cation (Fe/Co/Zn/Cd) transporter